MQTSAKSSAAWIAGAVLLNIFPWFGGPGWIWSALLLAGAAWIWFGKVQPWHFVVWALAACAQAIDNFYVGLGTIPWLVGAVLSVRAVAPMFDFSRFKRGYAPYAIFGALLCLWTPFWTWGHSAGWSSSMWMGGLDLNTHIDMNGDSYLGLDYNATKWLMPYYSPGYDWTGRAETGWFNATLIVLALLGWTLWRDEEKRHRTRLLPVVGALLLCVWGFPFLKGGYRGPVVFLAGAIGMGVCALMALRGQQAGAFDANDVAGRVQAEVRKRRSPRPNADV